MSIIIVSARIDERGRASGGVAGDQKQGSSSDYKGEVDGVTLNGVYVKSGDYQPHFRFTADGLKKLKAWLIQMLFEWVLLGKMEHSQH